MFMSTNINRDYIVYLYWTIEEVL